MNEPHVSPLYDEEFVLALEAVASGRCDSVQQPSQYRLAWRLSSGYAGLNDATIDHIEQIKLAREEEPWQHYSLGDWRALFGVVRKKTEGAYLDAAEVLSRVDMMRIVRPYLTKPPKQTKTDEYSALCPLHGEKTPSFTFNVRKKVFYCFGCGARGSALTFLMMIEGCDFQGALMVANEYGA